MGRRKGAGEVPAERVQQGPDGTFRWRHDVPMLKNPVILITVYKVLALSVGIEFALVATIDCFANGFDLEGLGELALVHACICLGLLALGALGYFIVAWSYGFKYSVRFEMDERVVRHIQMPHQFQRARALGKLTAMVGVIAGRPGTVGAGLLAASRNSSTSEFSHVSAIVVCRRLNTIKIRSGLFHNQVYVNDQDFDQVLAHIVAHCPQAKVVD
ncbi:MAG: hypothetical protein K6A65_07990 [Succinivibrionaceae bacterium]|nr:hypothetical protein [Succinivibrionaceae bacterium]